MDLINNHNRKLPKNNKTYKVLSKFGIKFKLSYDKEYIGLYLIITKLGWNMKYYVII